MVGARETHVPKNKGNITHKRYEASARLLLLFILTVDKRSVAEVAAWRSLIHSDGFPTPFDKRAVAEVVAWRSRGRILRTAGLPLNLQ